MYVKTLREMAVPLMNAKIRCYWQKYDGTFFSVPGIIIIDSCFQAPFVVCNYLLVRPKADMGQKARVLTVKLVICCIFFSISTYIYYPTKESFQFALRRCVLNLLSR